MRAPFGEVVLPITELIRVGAKVDGTSFRLRRWGLSGDILLKQNNVAIDILNHNHTTWNWWAILAKVL